MVSLATQTNRRKPSWICRSVSMEKVIDPNYWPPRNTTATYDWTVPTYQFYAANDDDDDEAGENAVNDNNNDDNDTNQNHEDGFTNRVVVVAGEKNRQVQETHSSVTTTTITESRSGTKTTSSSLESSMNNNDNPLHDNDHDHLLMNRATASSQPQQQSHHHHFVFSLPFQEARKRLDYSYHTNPVLNRQTLQDAIVQRVVSSIAVSSSTSSSTASYSSSSSSAEAEAATTTSTPLSSSLVGTTHTYNNTTTHANGETTAVHDAPPSSVLVQQQQQRPWIVFTAGAMGVGKGYVLMELQKANLFDSTQYIQIDPDRIKCELPEVAGYLQHNKATAATLLHRESTQIADILFEYALLNTHPIFVDGSLRDVVYYTQLLQRIRTEFPMYRLAIVHIVADTDIILARAKSRADRTGRVVPESILLESIAQVPRSVQQLSHLVDLVHTIANNEGRPLELLSSLHASSSSTDLTAIKPTWENFVASWREGGPYDIDGNDDEKDDDHDAIEESEDEEDDDDEFSMDQLDANLKNLLSLHDRVVGRATSLMTTSTTTDTTSGNTTKRRRRMSLPVVNMTQISQCSYSNQIAQSIWSNAYPNVCPRCSISASGFHDEICGICIHSCHICACTICNPTHAHCAMAAATSQSP